MNPAHAVENLRTLPAAATATFLALFPIVNPFGGIPLFFSLTSGFTPLERNRTALRTCVLRLRHPCDLHVLRALRLEFLWHFAVRVEDRGWSDCGEYRVGNGDWWGSFDGCRERRGDHQRRYFTHANGDADALGTRIDRGCDGIGSARRQPDCIPGHGDRHRWTGDFGLSVPAVGRPVGGAVRAERRGSNRPYFRIPDPRDRGAADLGWSGGLQSLRIAASLPDGRRRPSLPRRHS